LERRERFADASMFAGQLSTTYARWGRFGPAERWQVRAEELAARSGDPNAVLDAALTRGGLESERGNLHEALEATRRGVEEAERIGNTLCSLVGHFMLGDQQLRLGRPADAIDALERSGELAAYCDAGTFAALSEAWVAAARAQAGEGEPDWEEFDRALRLARDNGDRLGEGEVHRQRATALAARPQPDWDAVLADLRTAVDIFERIEAEPYLARALRDMGMALEVAGRPEPAADALRRARALLQRMASPPRIATDRPPSVPAS
ncbi:MAG TPA: hypothetical protein VHF25_15845, partial [Nitriliruptorales bacterium]|nr:hypothetical protein [Nitriliruptorales bacterium]